MRICLCYCARRASPLTTPTDPAHLRARRPHGRARHRPRQGAARLLRRDRLPAAEQPLAAHARRHVRADARAPAWSRCARSSLGQRGDREGHLQLDRARSPGRAVRQPRPLDPGHHPGHAALGVHHARTAATTPPTRRRSCPTSRLHRGPDRPLRAQGHLLDGQPDDPEAPDPRVADLERALGQLLPERQELPRVLPEDAEGRLQGGQEGRPQGQGRGRRAGQLPPGERQEDVQLARPGRLLQARDPQVLRHRRGPSVQQDGRGLRGRARGAPQGDEALQGRPQADLRDRVHLPRLQGQAQQQERLLRPRGQRRPAALSG